MMFQKFAVFVIKRFFFGFSMNLSFSLMLIFLFFLYINYFSWIYFLNNIFFSLNETVSGEPDTEDHHSDLLEQDISIDSPHRSRSNLGVGLVGYIYNR